MEPARLHFTIAEIFGGLAKAHGILVVTPEHLVFEYQMTDSIFGAISGGIVRRVVEYGEIAGVEARAGFFTPHLLFTANGLDTFAEFPRKNPATLRINVPWKHRKQIRSVLTEIELHRGFAEADRYRGRIGNGRPPV